MAAAKRWRNWRRKDLNQELVDRIAGHFRKGATVKIAAGLENLPAGVLRMWIREGEQQIQDIYDSGVGYPEHEGLAYDAWVKATAEYLMTRVEDVNDPEQAADWRASSWLLERRDDEFNPASRVEVSGVDGGPIAVAELDVSLGDLVALAQSLGAGHHFGLDEPDPLSALPGADEVLPDPSEREPAAAALPAVPGS